MLVGFLCNFTSVLCSIAFFFWAAFGREWSQTCCSLCLQQWPGCLICTVSLTFVTNELIPWDLTSTSIIHFVQIDTILINHFQIYPGRKLLCLEQRGEKNQRGRGERETYWIFQDLVWSAGDGPGQAKLCSDQDLYLTLINNKSMRRGQICNDTLPKSLHTFLFCTYLASFECIYIFDLHSLLVKKVLKLDHMNSFLNCKE